MRRGEATERVAGESLMSMIIRAVKWCVRAVDWTVSAVGWFVVAALVAPLMVVVVVIEALERAMKAVVQWAKDES